MHECGHICGFLKDFGISTVIDKLQQFVEDFLNVLNLFKICRDQRHLCDEFLFFAPETFLEVIFQFCLLLIQLFL